MGATGRNGKSLVATNDLVPVAGDGPADDALGTAEAVNLGRIYQVHTEVKGALDDPAGLAFGVRVPVAPLARAELPGPDTDHRDDGPGDV